jgi:hypothetical protein
VYNIAKFAIHIIYKNASRHTKDPNSGVRRQAKEAEEQQRQ